MIDYSLFLLVIMIGIIIGVIAAVMFYYVYATYTYSVIQWVDQILERQKLEEEK